MLIYRHPYEGNQFLVSSQIIFGARERYVGFLPYDLPVHIDTFSHGSVAVSEAELRKMLERKLSEFPSVVSRTQEVLAEL